MINTSNVGIRFRLQSTDGDNTVSSWFEILKVGYKRYSSTTPTLQVGTVVSLSPKRAVVDVPGMRQTVHLFKTIVKL